jgi:hypothetical protein
MDWKYFLDRFQFYCDAAANYHVDSVTTIKVDTLVVDSQRYLSSKIYVPYREFTAHTRLVSRLQQAGT